MNCLWCQNPEDISLSDNWCYWCNRYSSYWNLENILSSHAHTYDFKHLVGRLYISTCTNPVRNENCQYTKAHKTIDIEELSKTIQSRNFSRYLHSQDFKDKCESRYQKMKAEKFVEKLNLLEKNNLPVYLELVKSLEV